MVDFDSFCLLLVKSFFLVSVACVSSKGIMESRVLMKKCKKLRRVSKAGVSFLRRKVDWILFFCWDDVCSLLMYESCDFCKYMLAYLSILAVWGWYLDLRPAFLVRMMPSPVFA